MATHSSFLPGKSHGQRLQSMGLQKSPTWLSDWTTANLQGRMEIRWTMTQKHLQLLSTPSRSHWDDFIVNLGCGGLVLGNRTCLPKSSLWIDNWSHRHKEYLNQHLYHCLWGLAEHGGHLVMMIIKKLLLTTKALTTEMWLTGQYSPEWGQGEDRRSHTGPRCCQLPWQSYGLFDKKYKKYVFASLPYISGICTYTNRGCG